MATRIAYAFILLINSIISWIMLTPWALKKLQHLTFDYMKIRCDGKECYGWVAVHRINFGLGLFHLLLAFMLLGVQSSKNGRAGLQNGFWGPKIILWILFVVVSFFIPESFFFVYGNYIAFFCAVLFLLLGLILLVDLAHTWAEMCLEKIEDHDSRLWRGLLIGSTLGMYVASITMTVLMYVFFASSGCSMNQAAISVGVPPFQGGPIDNRHKLTDVGQPYRFPDHLCRFGPAYCARVEPQSRTSTGSHGYCLLYLLDYVCCLNGAG